MRQVPKTAIITLFFIIFIDTFCWFIIAPVLLKLYLPGINSILPITTGKATRYMLYGITMSLPPLAFIITAPFIGHSSDKFGRKQVLFCCLLATLAGFLLPIYGIIKHSISYIFIGRFIGGASTASQPVAQAAVTDFAANIKHKAYYLSIIALAMTLGLVLGPLAGGYLSDIKTPFYVGIILATLNLGFVIFFYKPQKKSKNFISTKIPLFNKKIMLLLPIFFLLEFSWSQYYQTSFLIFTQLFHYSTAQTANFAAYAGTIMCLGLAIISPLALRYINVKRLAIISMFTMSLGMLGCNAPSLSFQWIFVTLVSISTGIAYVSLITLLSENMPVYNQGWILGIAGSTLALAWLFTGFLSGFLANINIMLPLRAALGAILIGTCLIVLLCFCCDQS